MTRRIEIHIAGQCFAVHRKLFEAASSLARTLGGVYDDADLLSLGANCMRIAALAALAAHEPLDALRSWRECALAERQIRIATYRALRERCIDTDLYDHMFGLAAQASRIREDERQRLRRQLIRLA
jgi:hypothetical protein